MSPPTPALGAGGGQFVGYQCLRTSNTPLGWDKNDWPDILMNMSPYFWAYLGTGLALALSVVGSAWGIFTTGTSLLGASVKAPRVRSRNLVSIIFCEATSIYGLIIAIIMAGRIVKPPPPGVIPTGKCAEAYYAGYAYFWAGIAVGVSNLVAGIGVGISGSNTVIADAADPGLFVKMLIVGVMISALSIFAVIVAILIATGVDFPTF